MARRKTTKPRRREGAKRKPSPPAIASKYLIRLETLPADVTIGRWCRVSERGSQKTDHNLDGQDDNLRAEIEKRGAKVGKTFSHIGHGDDIDNGDLAAAIEWAQAKPKRVLLAETTDRWVRHEDYGTRNREVKPTVAQFKKLRRLAGGVTLATVLDPDATRKEVESYQKKRGQRAKGNKGGRPKKAKYKRLDELAENKLRWAAGMGLSVSKTAKLMRCSRSTAQSRLEKAKRQ
jgi:hypothetical protein